MSASKNETVAILGAGISGLSVAWLLKKRGVEVKLFEATHQIGGLARTFEWHGVKCDIGPHRLFTNDLKILHAFLNLIPMKAHKRQSKIFMRNRVIQDPINPIELVLKFPIKTSYLLIRGYIFRPKLFEDSFEAMALNNFGKGLYDFFFEPYTRKLLGVPPSQISAAWGKQKLRSSGLIDILKRNSKNFFRGFYYPIKGGYGAICDALYDSVHDSVMLNTKVIGLTESKGRINTVKYQHNGQEYSFACDRVISTIPATTLGNMLGHDFNLRFKAIQLVYLNINKRRVMPYHWIYFGDGDVVVNRLAEFKNFSDDYTAKENTVLCAEVTSDSDDPVEDVLKTLENYNLIRREDVVDTLIIPIKYGYPIYDKGYEEVTMKVSRIVNGIDNLHLVGRNAEFRHIDVDEDFSSASQLVSSLYDSNIASDVGQEDIFDSQEELPRVS
jgi:protoporphyrinogen oxidase